MTKQDKEFVLEILNHGVRQWFSENVDGTKSLEGDPKEVIDDRVYNFRKKLKTDAEFANVLDLDEPKMTDKDVEFFIDELYWMNDIERYDEGEDDGDYIYDEYTDEYVPESWDKQCEKMFG